MTSSVTRAVRFMSSVHSGFSSLKAGKHGAEQQFRRSFLTAERFPYFLGVLAIGSFTVGWKGMNFIRDEQERDHLEQYMLEQQRRRFDPHLARRRTIYAFNRRTLTHPASLATSE